MQQIAIKMIYDNKKENPAMQEGWGFSCLIDLGDKKILFDTGANKAAFFSNLKQLAIHPETITDVIFSHQHDDHITGLEDVLKLVKKGAHLFLPKGFPSYNLPSHIQTTMVSDFAEIAPQLYSFVLKGGEIFYEQALAIHTSKGVVIITGCAHPGITHLIETVKIRLNEPIYLVLGGFHLFKENEKVVGKIIDAFKALKVKKAAPCHCSGDQAITLFQEGYGKDFCSIGTGTILLLDK